MSRGARRGLLGSRLWFLVLFFTRGPRYRACGEAWGRFVFRFNVVVTLVGGSMLGRPGFVESLFVRVRGVIR